MDLVVEKRLLDISRNTKRDELFELYLAIVNKEYEKNHFIDYTNCYENAKRALETFQKLRMQECSEPLNEFNLESN